MQDKTGAQTVVLYWSDMFHKGSFKRVATTSGYTAGKESFVIQEAEGITGEAIRRKAKVRIVTTDKQSQAAELSDSTRLREVRVANQLLSDEDKASVKYDHRFDGAFTDALMVHPILGDTCHPLSSFFFVINVRKKSLW